MAALFWETRGDVVLLQSEPFRKLLFSPFQESGRTKSEEEGDSSVEREAESARDRLLLSVLHGVGIQVFGNVKDEDEADERLALLVRSHRKLGPEGEDVGVAVMAGELVRRLSFEDSGELLARYLTSLEDRSTGPTFNETCSRTWVARAFRRWLARPAKDGRGSDLVGLATVVVRLVRTSLLMQSAVPELPLFLGGFDGFPTASFAEIGREVVHSCRPTCRWTCLDTKFEVRGPAEKKIDGPPWTVNLVPHLDAFRRSKSDQWRRVAKLAGAETAAPTPLALDGDGKEEVLATAHIRGRGHAEMLRLIYGLECDCDGSSLRSEATLAAEEAFFETERRCGRCQKWHLNHKMRRCSGCKFQRYCNETCQRLHWSVHRQNCYAMSDATNWRRRLYRAAWDVALGIGSQ